MSGYESCRYGDILHRIVSQGKLICENYEANYQGFAKVLVDFGGTYMYYEYSYGSCSGCDTWEATEASDDDIELEMRREAAFFSSRESCQKFLDAKQWGGYEQTTNFAEVFRNYGE